MALIKLPRPIHALFFASSISLFLFISLPKRPSSSVEREYHQNGKKPNELNAQKLMKMEDRIQIQRRRIRRRVFGASEEQWARSIPADEDSMEGHGKRGKKRGRKGTAKSKKKKKKRGKALVSDVATDDTVLVLEKKKKPKRVKEKKKVDKGKRMRPTAGGSSRKGNGGKTAITKTKKKLGNGQKQQRGQQNQQQPIGNNFNNNNNNIPPNDGGEDGGGNGNGGVDDQQQQGPAGGTLPSQNDGNGNNKGKKSMKANDVLQLMLKLAMKGATDSECQWCAIQFLEKAMLGPFAPLASFISPKRLKQAKKAAEAGKKLLAEKDAILKAGKKGVDAAANAGQAAMNGAKNVFKKIKFG